jgi:DNA-directed RNA polymerase sigma subunit (sigma70/sigma32)
VIAAECGDSDACRKLVEAFLPAISGVALGFQSDVVEHEELLQEGSPACCSLHAATTRP